MADPMPANAATPGTTEERATFLNDLASAMHATAEQTHDRLLGGLDERTAAHLADVHSRAEEEASALRAKADGDVAEIQASSEAEIQRVKDEAEQRIAARRQALDGELSHHDSLVAGEIQGVQSAVEQHKAELADYFSRLHGATEPTTIARLAGTVPVAPDLAAVGAAARAAVSAPAPTPETQTAEAPEVSETPEPEAAAEPPAAAEAVVQEPTPELAAIEVPEPVVEATAVQPAEPVVEPPAAEVVAQAASQPVAEAATDLPAVSNAELSAALTADPAAVVPAAEVEAEVPQPIAEMPTQAEEGTRPEGLAAAAGGVVAADEQVETSVVAVTQSLTEPTADAQATAASERLLGVMDPEAATGGLPAKLPPWAVRLDELETTTPQPAADEPSPVPAAVGGAVAEAEQAAEPAAAQGTESAVSELADDASSAAPAPLEAEAASLGAEPEAVGAAAGEQSHSLLGSIPVLRPVGSWWNRANGNGNGAHEEDHGQG